MKFEELKKGTISIALWKTPDKVCDMLKLERVVLAGGLIRDTVAGLPAKDVDIFCRSEEQAARLACSLSSWVRHTTFAYSLELEGISVQFVYYKAFETPEELISQFDFRACCAGIYWDRDGKDWRGIAVEGFWEDCKARVLRFMSQKKDANKLTALRRALNFAGKGWTISDDELTAIVTHFEPNLTPERVKRSFRPAYGRI